MNDSTHKFVCPRCGHQTLNVKWAAALLQPVTQITRVEYIPNRSTLYPEYGPERVDTDRESEGVYECEGCLLEWRDMVAIECYGGIVPVDATRAVLQTMAPVMDHLVSTYELEQFMVLDSQGNKYIPSQPDQWNRPTYIEFYESEQQAEDPCESPYITLSRWFTGALYTIEEILEANEDPKFPFYLRRIRFTSKDSGDHFDLVIKNMDFL